MELLLLILLLLLSLFYCQYYQFCCYHQYHYYYYLSPVLTNAFLLFLLRDHNENKAVLCCPCHLFFIYILVYLVIAFSLRLKSVKIAFNILLILLVFILHCINSQIIFYMICIALTCGTTVTNFWHLIRYLFFKMAKYNLLTYLLTYFCYVLRYHLFIRQSSISLCQA